MNALKSWIQRRRKGQAIEEQTARHPSDLFLWAALVSMGISLTFKLMGNKYKSLFIGRWGCTISLLGVYNKLVKLESYD